jgi:hypothetical protein
MSNPFLALFILGLPSLLFAKNTLAAEPPQTPAELLKEYESLGLPLPPKSAKLVRYAGGGNSKERLAIEFKPGTILFLGVIESKGYQIPKTREIAPDLKAIEGVDLSEQEAVVLAVQCQSMGWDKLAAKILEQAQKAAKSTPLKHLHELAWFYWEKQITHPTADRGPVAKRLKELIARDAEFDTSEHRWLLERLELTVVPSKAKPGSVEALVDDLVNYNTNSGSFFPLKPGEGYQRIAALGFEAVPTLIEHLDDQRLTRAMMIGFNNFRSWHLRVCDLVGDLVERLADEELARVGKWGMDVEGNWLTRQQGYVVKKTAAQEWWEKAQKINEEEYLLNHVLSVHFASNSQSCINEHIWYVISVKYPKHIPNLKTVLYRRVLEKSLDVPTRALAKAIGESNIPEKEKLELFVQGAKHKVLDVRMNALDFLRTLDNTQFAALLLDTLKTFPKDIKDTDDYFAGCPETFICRLVSECDEPRVWQALKEAIERAEVGLRMELLNRLFDPFDNPNRKVAQLRLLASFLDDTTVRDRTSNLRFLATCAGSEYWSIEVRNFVALKIGRQLGTEIEVDPRRTKEDWALIRTAVKEKLKKEQDETKK